MDTIGIIIADDNKSFIEGIEIVLSTDSNYTVLDKCYNGQELVKSTYLHDAQIILSDIEMPLIDGIKAAKNINYRYPRLPMIALTMYMDRVFLNDIVNAGFRGFVYKPDTARYLLPTIEKVLNNEFVFPENLKLK